jgi:hypothetical protein
MGRPIRSVKRRQLGFASSLLQLFVKPDFTHELTSLVQLQVGLNVTFEVDPGNRTKR